MEVRDREFDATFSFLNYRSGPFNAASEPGREKRMVNDGRGMTYENANMKRLVSDSAVVR